MTRLKDVLRALREFDPDEPTGDAFLDARYDAHVEKFGDAVTYHRFFFNLAREHEFGLAVELGAWRGTCAAHLASGGCGTVATIDHHSDPGDDAHMAACKEAAQRYLNLFYFRGWTWDVYPEVRDLGKKIDFLFIDSWHDYAHAMDDWNRYKPLLADGALVACDDIYGPDKGPTVAGMKRFWAEMPEPKHLSTDLRPGFPMGFFVWEGS